MKKFPLPAGFFIFSLTGLTKLRFHASKRRSVYLAIMKKRRRSKGDKEKEPLKEGLLFRYSISLGKFVFQVSQNFTGNFLAAKPEGQSNGNNNHQDNSSEQVCHKDRTDSQLVKDSQNCKCQN